VIIPLFKLVFQDSPKIWNPIGMPAEMIYREANKRIPSTTETEHSLHYKKDSSLAPAAAKYGTFFSLFSLFVSHLCNGLFQWYEPKIT